MSEGFIIEQAAPTLAGIKTGNLFTCPYDSKETVIEQVKEINRHLVPKGLCLIPLRYSEKRVLLYLYRPAHLKRDLANTQALDILRSFGYDAGTSDQCIVHLISRLRSGDEFPHEIGLFLSYPPEDVKGFIENDAREYKYCGLWKVYGDEEKAKALFARYKKCANIYCRLLKAGFGIDQLAVAV